MYLEYPILINRSVDLIWQLHHGNLGKRTLQSSIITAFGPYPKQAIDYLRGKAVAFRLGIGLNPPVFIV